MASSAASFAEQLGHLLIDGFFDLEPFPSRFDFNRFSRQCLVYYYLMKNNPERKFPRILESRSSSFHAYGEYKSLIWI